MPESRIPEITAVLKTSISVSQGVLSPVAPEPAPHQVLREAQFHLQEVAAVIAEPQADTEAPA